MPTPWTKFRNLCAYYEVFLRACEHSSDEMGLVDVECALQFLANRYRIPLDPNNMVFAVRHADSRHEILNTAALFIGGKTKYTRNLLRELNQIKNEPDSVLDTTALAYVFRDPPLESVASADSAFRIPATFTPDPLNHHQTKAIEEALNNPVSKVTGPPGTGKSHMSVNLIANEVYHGGSVLFTSKNHKAVHAVFDMCRQAIHDDDFPLMEFCTVPGNSSCADWRNYAKNVGVRIALVRKRYGNQGNTAVPNSEHLFPEIERVEKAFDDFRDARETVETYERLRSRASELEKLLTRIESAISEVPNVMRDSAEYRVLLKDVLAALEKNPPQRWWKRILAKLLGTEEQQRPDIGIRRQLDKLLPHLATAFSSKGTLSREIRRLLGNLHVRDVVRALEENEIHAIRQENSERNYENLLAALQNAKSILEGNIHEAFSALSGMRALSIEEPEDIVAKVTDWMRTENLSPLPFLTGLGDDGKYQKVVSLFRDFHHVFPAWATTLLSLVKASPCLPGVFSLTIIDEASQCEIPPIIPALFRSQRIAVVGDPDQFPPVVTLDPGRNRVFRAKHGTSGLDFAKYSYTENNAFSVIPCQAVQLVEHFRCEDSIASYFNNEFYNGNLCPCVGNRLNDKTDWRALGINPGMEWMDAPGGDAAEISAALACLKELKRHGFQGSVGVISPLRSLANEMKTQVHRFKHEMPDNLDIDEHINTANGFQGGQCDVIIFLLGLNENRSHGETWYISDDSNKYIFNVSVSRAKVRFTTVGDRKKALETGLTRITNLIPNQRPPMRQQIGPGERILKQALANAGIETEAQYPICNRWLDLAIPERKIDIEVDGQAWHLDRNGCRKADDIHRDLLLKTKGWRVIRIWHCDIVNDVESCVRRIQNAIDGESRH